MEHTDYGFWHISLEASFVLGALIFGGDAQAGGTCHSVRHTRNLPEWLKSQQTRSSQTEAPRSRKNAHLGSVLLEAWEQGVGSTPGWSAIPKVKRPPSCWDRRFGIRE
jgi:hypothetical protein